jgi:ubiquitin-like modifier-activating enzyme ATG7
VRRHDFTDAIILDVALPTLKTGDTPSNVSGLEKNSNGKLGSRSVDLAPMMDPKILARTAVDLNLKLMRWRILPDLDLDRISRTRVLLFGSGTLGCYVARSLMV